MNNMILIEMSNGYYQPKTPLNNIIDAEFDENNFTKFNLINVRTSYNYKTLHKFY
jgi:hypothetical protein